MSNSLFVFGDSWPYGIELKDCEKPFGHWLADKLCIKNYHNYSQPATSIHHLILQLKEAISNSSDAINDSIAVFFLTGTERDLYYTGNNVESLSPMHQTGHADKCYYKYIRSKKLVEYKVNTSLIALQGLCQKYNINDYYIWGWDRVDLWDLVDNNKIYNKTIAEEFCGSANVDFFDIAQSKNVYIYPNDWHPNQTGHHKIAEILDNFIRSSII